LYKRCVSHVVTLLTVSSLSKELFLLIPEEIYVEMTPRPNAPDPSRNGDRSGPIDKSEAGQVSDVHYLRVLRIRDPGSGAFLTPGSGMGKKNPG
jgi:hypothetical protein